MIKIEETINSLVEEIEQNELMNKKCKKVWMTLSYIEHFLGLVSVVTGCISISAFASLLGISIKITGSAIRLKILVITGRIKKIKSIIKKKKEAW